MHPDDEISESFYNALTLAYESCYTEDQQEARRSIHRDYTRALWVDDIEENRKKRRACVARMWELTR